MSGGRPGKIEAVAVKDAAGVLWKLLAVSTGLLWLQFFLALSFTWSNGKYYSYGWLVPVLAALCLARNWQRRFCGRGESGFVEGSAVGAPSRNRDSPPFLRPASGPVASAGSDR